MTGDGLLTSLLSAGISLVDGTVDGLEVTSLDLLSGGVAVLPDLRDAAASPVFGSAPTAGYWDDAYWDDGAGDFGTVAAAKMTAAAPGEIGNAMLAGSSLPVIDVGFENQLTRPVLIGEDGVGKIMAGEDDYSTGGDFSSDPVSYSGQHTYDAGDVNGDGFADLIVNSYTYSDGTYSSSTYIVFGVDGDAAAPDVSEIDGSNGFVLAGGSDGYGPSAEAAGDINGDGFADLIVNTYGDGQSDAAYVLFGKAGGYGAVADGTGLDGGNGFRLDTSSFGATDSWWAGAAGDVNGDGFADLRVGISRYNDDGSYSDTMYIILGKTGGFDSGIDVTTLDGSDGYVVAPEEPADDGGIIDDGDGIVTILPVDMPPVDKLPVDEPPVDMPPVCILPVCILYVDDILPA